MAAFANCFYGALQALAMRAAKLLSICRNAATGWVRTLLVAHDLSFASCHRGTREIGCGLGVVGDHSCGIFCEDHPLFTLHNDWRRYELQQQIRCKKPSFYKAAEQVRPA